MEAVSITILVGLSCDFSLHLAEAYSHSSFHGRGNRGKDAVARVGSPIFAAGVTTFLAVIPMLGCTIQAGGSGGEGGRREGRGDTLFIHSLVA